MTQKTLVSLLAALSLATPISAQVPPLPGAPSDAATDITIPGLAELPHGQDTYSVRVRDLETKELKLPNFDDDNPNDLAYVTLEPGKRYSFELDDPTEYFNLNKETGTKFFTEGGSKIKKGKNEKYLVVLPGTTTKHLPFQFVAPFTMRARFVNKNEKADRDELVISDKEEPVEIAGSAQLPHDATTEVHARDASTELTESRVAEANTDGATDFVVAHADGESEPIVVSAPFLWTAYASLGALGLSENQVYSAQPHITQNRERNLLDKNYIAGFEAGFVTNKLPVGLTLYFTRANNNTSVKTRLGALIGTHNVNGNNTYGGAVNLDLEQLLSNDEVELEPIYEESTDGSTEEPRIIGYHSVEPAPSVWKNAFARLNAVYAYHTFDFTKITPTLTDAQGNAFPGPSIINNKEVSKPSFGFDLALPALAQDAFDVEGLDLGVAAGWNHELLKFREIREGVPTPFNHGANDEAYALALLRYNDIFNGSLGLDFQRESNSHYPGVKLGEPAPASFGHGIRGDAQYTGLHPVTLGLDFVLPSPVPAGNAIDYNQAGVTAAFEFMEGKHVSLGAYRFGRELARTPGKVTLMDKNTSFVLMGGISGTFGDGELSYVPKKSGADMFRKFSNHKP